MLGYPYNAVIDCRGKVFDCRELLGDKHAVGQLEPGGTIKYNKRFYDNVFYDPTEDKKCRVCKLLPICMGGCKPRIARGDNCDIYMRSEQEINMKINGEAAKQLFGG